MFEILILKLVQNCEKESLNSSSSFLFILHFRWFPLFDSFFDDFDVFDVSG